MAEPFYYLSAEDRVPRDAVYVIIGGSITVVAPGTFQFCENLERVELQEGVEEIGVSAFFYCSNLARVDCPPSLRTISYGAFYGCQSLSELNLREGLERIGEGAFNNCALERITIPSSAVEIGVGAFAGCRRLSELNLREGLRRIRASAFYECKSLRRITVPSSVVEIGEEAFSDCDNLAAATLARGMVMLARGAFLNCPRLEQIEIPSMAIVVKAGEDGNGRAAAVTGGMERSFEEPEPAQLILTSRYLALMSQEDRATFTDAINQMTDDQTRGAGPLDLGDEGVADPIRHCFANCLAEYKTGVAAVLELALWKANMDQRREVSRARAAGGGKRARVDAPTRDDCRRTCGADAVIGPVLSYLWGPHRRANQEENGGAIIF